MSEFPIVRGSEIEQGIVVGITLTAYEVVTSTGEEVFVPFAEVHGLSTAVPLVTLAATPLEV